MQPCLSGSLHVHTDCGEGSAGMEMKNKCMKDDFKTKQNAVILHNGDVYIDLLIRGQNTTPGAKDHSRDIQTEIHTIR